MTFWKRFRMYLLGVGLGVVLVYFFFGKEKTERALWGWLPKNAIKSEMLSFTLIWNNDKLNCFNHTGNYKIDSSSIVEIIKSGNVNFNKSDTRIFPKKYVFEDKQKDINYTFIKQDSLEQVVLLEIKDINGISFQNCVD
jgi:hypothetical protein